MTKLTKHMMTLQELQDRVGDWGAYNFPKAKPHEPLLGMSEEVGELSHAHLKMEQGIRGTPTEHIAAKKDAIGDIFIYAAHYCKLNGLNLAECIEVAWNEVKHRDWINFPKNGRTE